jgi:hypothetical protein
MRFKVALLFLTMLWSGACWCDSNSADAPSLSQQDHWKYQVVDGFTGREMAITDVRVVKATADGYQLESVSNSGSARTLEITSSLNERQSIDGVDRDTNDLDFPLKIGKKWKSAALVQNTDNSTIILLDLEREVVALEKVKVPAGDFDAYKIVAKGEWILKADPLKVANTDFRGRFELTAWYAPSVKRYVAIQQDSYAKGHVGRRSKTYLIEYELH